MTSRSLRMALVLTTFAGLLTIARTSAAEERVAGRTLLRGADLGPIAAATKEPTRRTDLEHASKDAGRQATAPERVSAPLRAPQPQRVDRAPVRIARARTAIVPWADASETAPLFVPTASSSADRAGSPIDSAFHSLIGLMTPAPVAAEGVRFTPLFLGWTGLGLNVTAKL